MREVPVVSVLGAMALSLLVLVEPVGRRGAPAAVVTVGDAVVVVVVWEGVEDSRHDLEVAQSAPFWQHPPPRELAQLCQPVAHVVTVATGSVVVVVDVVPETHPTP